MNAFMPRMTDRPSSWSASSASSFTALFTMLSVWAVKTFPDATPRVSATGSFGLAAAAVTTMVGARTPAPDD